MTAAGVIKIHTFNQSITKGSSHAMKPGEYAAVEISDTGPGIPPGIKEHIFEPFFTTKPKGKGTGLGLSTVYGIIQQHKGDISVISAPGKGAAFTIRIPKAA
jgi:signal transduction histidine kinase